MMSTEAGPKTQTGTGLSLFLTYADLPPLVKTRQGQTGLFLPVLVSFQYEQNLTHNVKDVYSLDSHISEIHVESIG